MRIDIVDIPNGQLVESIKFEILFKDGTSTITTNIKPIETKNEERVPNIPTEMTDLEI